MPDQTKCRYMDAAYPTMEGRDTCYDHRHDAPTFALARAIAVTMQQPDPTDEQVAWFLDDAAAVVDDFDPTPSSWTVTAPEVSREPGLELTFTINGVDYVTQQNDSGGHVVGHPVSRSEWEEWIAEEADEPPVRGAETEENA